MSAQSPQKPIQYFSASLQSTSLPQRIAELEKLLLSPIHELIASASAEPLRDNAKDRSHSTDIPHISGTLERLSRENSGTSYAEVAHWSTVLNKVGNPNHRDEMEN